MKTLKIIMLGAVVLLVSSCSQGHSPENVAERIQKGEALTEADYTVMIDYCGTYATKAQTLQDAIDNLPAGSDEAAAKATDLRELTDSYPLLTIFNKKIESATQQEVGEANVQRINGFASLIWFNAPDWAQIDTDPDAAGFVEQINDSGDTITPTGETVELPASGTE